MTDQPTGHVIAVVDDDQRIIAALELLLESADFSVRSFTSAEALLESGCLARIDCLISDIGMPVMDGFHLLRMIRAQRPDLPAILITGHVDKLNQLPPAGVGNYLLFKKPFDGQELLTTIGDALQNPRPREV